MGSAVTCGTLVAVPDPRLSKALGALRLALGVHDVVTDGRDTIWVMAAPRTLRRSLGPHGSVRNWIYATDRKGGHNARSYADNADHWSGWADAINYGLGHLGVKDDWTILPLPVRTLPRKTWSAKRQRWVERGPRLRFRLCDRPPVPFGNAAGPVLLHVANDIPPLFLSHGVTLANMRDVRRCKGLLWPSFALAWRLPPAYGDVVFFGSASILMDTLKPSGRHQRDLYLAGTDIWSPNARELALLEKAVEWEFAGDNDWWNGERKREEGGWGQRVLQNDLLSETLVSDSLVGGMSYFEDWKITEPILHRRALIQRFRELLRVYADPSDPYAYPERDEALRISDAPYPYGELKVTGIVLLRDLPLVIYPKRISASVTTALDELDFQGTRLPIPYDGPLHADATDAERREYASIVTRTLHEWAKDPCHYRGAKVGKTLIRSDGWKSTYKAEALWFTCRGYWERGFCGAKDPGERAASRLSRPMRDLLAMKQRDPHRWGLETAAALRALRSIVLAEDEEIVRWYELAEASRFRLSAEDARTASSLGWFESEVSPGEEVVVLRLNTPLDPAPNPALDSLQAVKQRLLR